MIDISTGKQMTRGGFLKGILASGIAPSITLAAIANARSANASVARGMMRGIGERNAAMFGGGKPTAKDYVQDGLIAMWDGIENAGWGNHQSSNFQWVDLIGSNTLSAIETSYFEWTSNSLSFSKQSSKVPSAYTTMSGVMIDNLRFFEIVLNRTGDVLGNGLVWAVNGYVSGSSMCLWEYSNSHLITINYGVKQSYQNNTISKGIPCSLSFPVGNSVGQIYKDGNTQSILSIADGWGGGAISNRFWICSQGVYDNGGAGEIMAIRAYSRVLSSQEVAANYAIDKARFNLP